MPAPAARDGRFQARPEAGHILHGQKAAFTLLEGHDFAGDIAAIKRRMRCRQPRKPAFG